MRVPTLRCVKPFRKARAAERRPYIVQKKNKRQACLRDRNNRESKLAFFTL